MGKNKATVQHTTHDRSATLSHRLFAFQADAILSRQKAFPIDTTTITDKPPIGATTKNTMTQAAYAYHIRFPRRSTPIPAHCLTVDWITQHAGQIKRSA